MKLNKKAHVGRTGIYCIRNLSNGKVYIGKAKCIYTRVKQHITLLNRRSKDENPHLINSWHKYGKDVFEYFVVELCSIEKLAERELFWQENFDCHNREKGYNIRRDSLSQTIVYEETREKLRQAQIQRPKRKREMFP